MRLAWSVLLWVLVPSCGLTLDYDPPTDGGMDGPGTIDAAVECSTDLDCADGDLCDGHERCLSGRCEPAIDPVTCFDDDVCDGRQHCEPTTGECVDDAPIACPADDGDPCNGTEICDPVAGCSVLPPPDCDDHVDCTVDSCDPELPDLCTHRADDAACPRAGGTCTPMGCTYACTSDGDCVSDNPCVVSTCDTSAGRCMLSGIVCSDGSMCCGGSCVPMGCEDGNDCTDDSCESGGCVHVDHDRGCDDGDRCTRGDHCVAGACVATGPTCAAASPCHTALCDDLTGDCSEAPLDGVPCFDGDPCTVADTCRMGACIGLGRPLCDDGDLCTADECLPGMGCSHPTLPDGVSCGALGICLRGTCVIATCVPGTSDCDGEPGCECSGRCVPTGTGATTCATSDCTFEGCSDGSTSCCGVRGPEFGTCFDPVACPTCCLALD